MSFKVNTTVVFSNSAVVPFGNITSLPSTMPTSVSISGPSTTNIMTGLYYSYRVTGSGNSLTFY